MFTKRIRTGTVGVGVTRPTYTTVIDWGAVAGTGVVIVIILLVLGS